MISPKQVGKTVSFPDFTANSTATFSGSVEQYRLATFAQTTAGIAVTFPNPSVTATRTSVDIVNSGTVPLTVCGVTLYPQTSSRVTWEATSWVGIPAGVPPIDTHTYQNAAAWYADTTTAFTSGDLVFVKHPRLVYKCTASGVGQSVATWLLMTDYDLGGEAVTAPVETANFQPDVGRLGHTYTITMSGDITVGDVLMNAVAYAGQPGENLTFNVSNPTGTSCYLIFSNTYLDLDSLSPGVTFLVSPNTTQVITFVSKLTSSTLPQWTYTPSEAKREVLIPNKTVNGVVGTAAATVDIATVMVFAQTTPGIILTLPLPTDPSQARNIGLVNGGATPLVISNQMSPLRAGGSVTASYSPLYARWFLDTPCTVGEPSYTTTFFSHFSTSGSGVFTGTSIDGLRYVRLAADVPDLQVTIPSPTAYVGYSQDVVNEITVMNAGTRAFSVNNGYRLIEIYAKEAVHFVYSLQAGTWLPAATHRSKFHYTSGTIVGGSLVGADAYDTVVLTPGTVVVDSTLTLPAPVDTSVPHAVDVVNQTAYSVTIAGETILSGRSMRYIWDTSTWYPSVPGNTPSIQAGVQRTHTDITAAFAVLTLTASTALTTAGAASQRVPFTSANQTSANGVTVGTNTLTIVTEGTYVVNASVSGRGTASAFFAQIVKNGNTVLNAQANYAGGAFLNNVSPQWVGTLAAGDTLDVRAGTATVTGSHDIVAFSLSVLKV